MEYFEFNAANPRNRGNAGKVFIILRRASVYTMFIAAALILILLPWNARDGVSQSTVVFYNILIILLVEMPLLGCYFLFRQLARRYFEYDYFIYGDVMRIVRIQNNLVRKPLIDVNLCDIESVGIYKSDSYSLAETSADKTESYACNATSPFYMYIAATCEGKRKMLILEYDYLFTTALRRAMKRESAFDRDLLLLLRKEEQAVQNNKSKNSDDDIDNTSPATQKNENSEI